MPACEACHKAKVHCDNKNPCGRCSKKGLTCILRISRQGKRRRLDNESTTTNVHAETNDSTSSLLQTNNTSQRPSEQRSEDQEVIQDVANLGQHHFGVQYLIYSWTSFAFTRRSFSLLGRASRLAAKCGVSMDQVFHRQRQAVLNDRVFFDSAIEQQAQGHCCSQRLEWADLPKTLLEVCGAGQDQAVAREERYILVRQAKHGHSRFLTSRAFDTNIVSCEVLQHTWDNNTQPIVMTFLQGQADFDKFAKAISVQIANYKHANKQPIRTRVPGVKLKMKNGQVRQVELLHCYELLSLEDSFYLSEYIFVNNDDGGGIPDSFAPTRRKQSTLGCDESTLLFENLDDLLLDPDLERILNLID